ncbi:MAG: hypothetical protein WCV50_02810 [Patescibacteria group bacterium]|jgi:hypothetical protein
MNRRTASTQSNLSTFLATRAGKDIKGLEFTAHLKDGKQRVSVVKANRRDHGFSSVTVKPTHGSGQEITLDPATIVSY